MRRNNIYKFVDNISDGLVIILLVLLTLRYSYIWVFESLKPLNDINYYSIASGGVFALIVCLAVLRFFKKLTSNQTGLFIWIIAFCYSLLVFWRWGPAPIFLVMTSMAFALEAIWIKGKRVFMPGHFLHTLSALALGWVQFNFTNYQTNPLLSALYTSWTDFASGYILLPIAIGLYCLGARILVYRYWHLQQRYIKQSNLLLLKDQHDLIHLLSRGIVHDMNNLLLPLIGNHEYLQEKLSKCAGDHIEDLELIEEDFEFINKQRDLMRMFLKFSSASILNNEIINVEDMVRQSMHLLRSQLPRKADFQIISSSSLTNAKINGLQLFQCLANLIKNASDAKSPDRELQVVIELARNDGVDITVSDNGVGIPAALLNEIFDADFTTKGEKGFGVGLSTVKAIIESIGGTVTVTSVEDSGSSFRIHLPDIK
jgi:signal transduction histidine kinase